MNSQIHLNFLALLLPAVASFFLYRKFAGLAPGSATLAWLLTTVPIGAVFFIWQARNTRYQSEMPLSAASAAGCIMLLLPFLTKLHGKWIGGKLTEAERAPGAEGFRAWLSLSNIVVAVFVSLAGWQGFGIGLPLMFLLTIGALAAWPLMNTLPADAGTPREPVSENLSAERAKVLSLLEAGKITADESTELLNALGATRSAARTPAAPLSFGRKLVLAGSAVILVGFFLPWFTFSPMGELSAAFNQMRQSFPMAEMAIPEGFPSTVFPGANNSALGTVTINGGNVGHGLGWITLVLTLAAGLLPYVMKDLDRATLRTCRFVALAAGSFILLYLLTQNLRMVSIGLVLAAAGCALQWVGLLGEQRAG